MIYASLCGSIGRCYLIVRQKTRVTFDDMTLMTLSNDDDLRMFPRKQLRKSKMETLGRLLREKKMIISMFPKYSMNIYLCAYYVQVLAPSGNNESYEYLYPLRT